MKSISRVAVAAVLAAVTISAPAVAQKAKPAAAAAGPKLSKPVQSLLAQAQTAQTAGDHPGALTLLNQALVVPNSGDVGRGGGGAARAPPFGARGAAGRDR